MNSIKTYVYQLIKKKCVGCLHGFAAFASWILGVFSEAIFDAHQISPENFRVSHQASPKDLERWGLFFFQWEQWKYTWVVGLYGG